MGEREPAHDTEPIGADVSPADVPLGGHTPVLLERCLELLGPALRGPRPVHVDATLGLGGHAEAVLERFPALTLVGLDRDPHALARAGQRLAPYADRTHLVHAVYDELPDVLARLGVATVDSVLFDLGVSSMQLDETARGFSYAHDAPLDMRMDPTRGVTAEEVVNTYPTAQLARILKLYGEERFAGRIAGAIARARAKERITSSVRLAGLIVDAIPAATRRTGGHPAKRSFQALRIEVNDELAALEAALPAALEALPPGGRIVVLAYHSLEDRIVKTEFASWARSTAPIELPIEPPGTGPRLRLLTRGAEPPSDAEVAANARAASVRLRAAERIDPNAGPPRPRAAMHQPAAGLAAPPGSRPSGSRVKHRRPRGSDEPAAELSAGDAIPHDDTDFSSEGAGE